MHVGIAGEVRCVVTKADGTVKTDTGFQKNIILNQGLDFFGGGKGNYINNSCAIGSGNSAPAITQTGLDAFIALSSGTDKTNDYSYVDTGDGLYRVWEQKKYRFTGLNNVNISELGLVSTGTTSANYYLTTRVLIKDNLGAPTSISVKTGETLDIYYKIHKVIDIRDKAFVINVLDGDGGAVPYNVVIRPAAIGTADWINYMTQDASFRNDKISGASIADLIEITSTSYGKIERAGVTIKSNYVTNSNKLTISIPASLSQTNVAIRKYIAFSQLGTFQIRFGRISDDAPLTKTANDTLLIPLEFSWGRYEGVL